MTILEPTTTITDLILAGMAFYFGHMVFWKQTKTVKSAWEKRYFQYWAVAFLCMGIGALLGAMSHGFPYLANTLSFLKQAWPLTVLSIGLASFYLFLTVIMEYFVRYRNFLFLFAYLKVTAFMLLLFGYPKPYFGKFESVSFLLVIIDYVPILLLLGIMNVLEYLKTKAQPAKLMAIGVGLSFVAAAFQVLKIGIHKHFNHNDIYHVIQMVAIYLFYKSVKTKKILKT